MRFIYYRSVKINDIEDLIAIRSGDEALFNLWQVISFSEWS